MKLNETVEAAAENVARLVPGSHSAGSPSGTPEADVSAIQEMAPAAVGDD